MTSCAFKIHRESEPARGKPVLISILAFSLVFHAATLERSSFRENPFRPIPDAEYLVLFVERFMAREVRCWVTERHTCACAPRVNQGNAHPHTPAKKILLKSTSKEFDPLVINTVNPTQHEKAPWTSY